MSTQIQSRLPLTYINIRKIIGILAMSLPIIIFLAEAIFLPKGLQPSISAYYYTDMRWFFVLTLCSIGFFLFFYQGYDKTDKWLARVAGVAALLTALFPTEPPYLDTCISPLATFLPLGQHDLGVGKPICNTTSIIHLLSAATMFLVVAFFSFFRFTLGESRSKEKIIRNRIYRTCSVIIAGAILVIGLSTPIAPQAPDSIKSLVPFVTYWGEFVALFAFGVTWAVKGEMLWKDTTSSNNSKKFNELQSLQYQGYKNGLPFYVFLVAIWFTALLFAADIPPFNLFEEEKKETASTITAAVSGEEGEKGGQIPKIQALNPEVFSALCYPEGPSTEDTNQAESTCKYFNVDSNHIEVELKVANISGDPVDLSFDIVYDKPCKKHSACIDISPTDVNPETGLMVRQIGKNASETFIVSFPMEEIKGKLALIGGDSVSEIPFEVTTEATSIENAKIPTGETRSLGFYKTDARNILTGVLFVLVVVIFYFILNHQILSPFWPLVRRNFRADLGNDSTGEKEALWSLFSNQVNEMGVQSRFSINPKGESAISTPATFVPENSYLKAFFDLTGWIFPRLGYSLRLNKVSSKNSGTGLSLAVVKNDKKENIAERTFWAKEFGINEVEEEKGEDQGKDLEVQKYLMIPAYFWFADIVDRMDGFEAEPHAWQSAAYYHLGDLLWHSDLEKGINCYGNSINFDQTNWPAYAALGRVWIEKSQEQSKKIAIEYLLLASCYLATAIDGLKNQQIKDQVYFGALYNQVVALKYLLKLDWKKPGFGLQELRLQGFEVKKTTLLALSNIQEELIQRKQLRLFSRTKAAPQTEETDTNEKQPKDINDKIERLKNQCERALSTINQKIIEGESDPEKEDKTKISGQELKSDSIANWLLEFLPTFEFVLQGLEMQIGSFTIESAIEQLVMLPCFEKPINMDQPLKPDDKTGYHFTRSHYRVQYNAACFYSQIASIALKKDRQEFYIDLALDHLVMALSGGGGLVKFAKKDSALDAIRDHPRYKEITKQGKGSEKNKQPGKGNLSVYRRRDGKWVYKSHGAKQTSKAYGTQAEAVTKARKVLSEQGGGELIVHGADGKIRQKDTIAPGNDPRSIKG